MEAHLPGGAFDVVFLVGDGQRGEAGAPGHKAAGQLAAAAACPIRHQIKALLIHPPNKFQATAPITYLISSILINLPPSGRLRNPEK